MSEMRASRLVPLDIFFLRNLATSHVKCSQLAALLCRQRQREEGGRQGTVSLLRLPQFLFNCLLIYLITAATRTSGQAASMLSLKQFVALKLLLLDNPPSLLGLHHKRPKHRVAPSSSASPPSSSEMSQLTGATLPHGSRGRRPRRQEAQDTRTESGEASTGGLNPQIPTNASMACVTAYQISTSLWHFPPSTLIKVLLFEL